MPSNLGTGHLQVRLKFWVCLHKMATVDDQELSQVLARYYSCQLSTVVVESQACAERLTQMLRHSNSYLPDMLPMEHCHVKSVLP